MWTLAERQDADKLIKLAPDYPWNSGQCTPFLNTDVLHGNEGETKLCMFRKPQRKPLGLSHKTNLTKIGGKYANTAEGVSSDLYYPRSTQLYQMVDIGRWFYIVTEGQ